MKNSHSLPEVFGLLQEEQKIKRDYRTDTRAMSMTLRMSRDEDTGLNEPVIRLGQETYGLRATAHKQLAARIGVPVSYYGRMQAEAPALLTANINHWLKESPDTLTLRTLGPELRAVLGKQYRIIDHLELLSVMLPLIHEKYPQMKYESVHLGDDRLYIKAVLPTLEREVRKGDPVQAGVVITNSETGDTTLRIEPLVLRLVCTNGMIRPDNAFKRRHVGVRSNIQAGESVEYKDDTLAADNKAIILKARDSMEHILSDTAFDAIVEKMRDSTHKVIEEPIPAVKEVTRQFDFTVFEQAGILAELMRSQDMTQYGLVNAITRHAQDAESYDRSTELEAAAYGVLDLPRGDWLRIQRATAYGVA